MTYRAPSLRPNLFSLIAHHTNCDDAPDNAKPKGGTKNEATGIRPSTNLMVTHPLKAQTSRLTYKLTQNSQSDITPCTPATGTQCRLSELRSSLVLHLVRWYVTQHGCHYPTKPTGRTDQKMLRVALNLNSQHTTNRNDELHQKH